jgi:hypothetical protein
MAHHNHLFLVFYFFIMIETCRETINRRKEPSFIEKVWSMDLFLTDDADTVDTDNQYFHSIAET